MARRKCQCQKSAPSFGLAGDATARWCASCPEKLGNAVDLTNRKCVCGKSQPSLGLEVGKPLWCAKCPQKDANARNVVTKKCACGKAIPSFGLKDGKPLWCASCPQKDANAKNVVEKKCVCGKSQPTLGLQGGKPLWCSACPQKDANSRNVVKKRCVCGKARPYFGLENGKPLWCASCPQKDANASNVLDGKCMCGKARPNFGLENGKPLWCASCPQKDASAKDVKNRRCACGKARANLGLEDGKPLWCSACPQKDSNASNVVSKKCVSSWCDVLASNPHYRGHCLRCFARLYPDEPVSQNYKTKERLVIACLKGVLADRYPQFSSVARFDKTVDGGCSRRRPDAFVDVLTHVVMGEIDEEGHSTEEYCRCENKRMMQLMQDVGMRPIVIIRLNPDAFKDSNGIRQRSCFKRGKDGRLLIADNKRWQRRLDIFTQRFCYHLDNIPQSEVTAEHLFYDGFI